MKATIAREMQCDYRVTYARHLQPRSKTRFETHADDDISKSSLFANQGLHGTFTRLDGTKTCRQLADEGPQAMPGPPTRARVRPRRPKEQHRGSRQRQLEQSFGFGLRREPPAASAGWR